MKRNANRSLAHWHLDDRRSVRQLHLMLVLATVLGGFYLPIAAAQPPVLLVLGDSLSAAFGIEVKAGWVERLQQRFHRQGEPYRVVNASISGDTTATGLARLPQTLAIHSPAIVLVELGGNDGLQGLDLGRMRSNLEAIVGRVQASGAKVLLLGMRIPPNYGAGYTDRFHGIYAEVAEKFAVPLVPFLLAGIADNPKLMQADGIHPKSAAQEKILGNVWTYLEPLL